MKKKQEVLIQYFRDGKSERSIARGLSISRTTVRRYIKSYREAQQHSSYASEDTLLQKVVEAPRYSVDNRTKRKLSSAVCKEIDRLLELNRQKRTKGLHKQILKKFDIYEHLYAWGYDIGYTTVCNYIRLRQNKQKEAYIRQEYVPGDICEFDWGEVKLYIAGKLRRLNLAVFTSAMSNYRYALLFWRQDTYAFQQAHADFFAHLGGVYHTMVYDNMRVALRRLVGDTEKHPTEALLKLSMYYQFDYRFCNIYRANEKGHVERSVEFIRRKAFADTDVFDSIAEANMYLVKHVNQINTFYNRFINGERASDLFARERPYLYSAPRPFDCSILQRVRIDKYATFSYATNHYSVPDHLVGQIIEIKIYPNELICYHNHQELCRHERRYTTSQWYLILEHYLPTLRKKPGALAGSVALKSASEKLRDLYYRYFSQTPREFIELLLLSKEYEISYSRISAAVDYLHRISPHDISYEKIKTICLDKTEHNDTQETIADDISHFATNQLTELSKLIQ